MSHVIEVTVTEKFHPDVPAGSLITYRGSCVNITALNHLYIRSDIGYLAGSLPAGTWTAVTEYPNS